MGGGRQKVLVAPSMMQSSSVDDDGRLGPPPPGLFPSCAARMDGRGDEGAGGTVISVGSGVGGGGRSRSDSLDTDTGESSSCLDAFAGVNNAKSRSRSSSLVENASSLSSGLLVEHHRRPKEREGTCSATQPHRRRSGVGSAPGRGGAPGSTDMLVSLGYPSVPSGSHGHGHGEVCRRGSGRTSRSASSTEGDHLWNRRQRRLREDSGLGAAAPPTLACPDYAGTSASASTASAASSSSIFSAEGRRTGPPGGPSFVAPPPEEALKATRRRLHSHSSNSQTSDSAASATSYGPVEDDEGGPGRPFGMPTRPSSAELEGIKANASPIAFFTDATTDGCGGCGDDPHRTRISVTPLTKIPYVHGGYSAVAPMMIRDARWMAILRRLMPESHTGIATLLRRNAARESSSLLLDLSRGGGQSGTAAASAEIDPVRIMKWAENNPVVAAYGMLNSDAGRRPRSEGGPARSAAAAAAARNRTQKESEKRHSSTAAAAPRQEAPSSKKPALEWDVFLDPILVRHVDRAMQAVDDMPDNSENDYEARIAADVEVDRQVSRLMNRMMLAHGSTTQLLAEAVGMAPKFNFSRVVEQGESRRRKTLWRSTTAKMLGEKNAVGTGTTTTASTRSTVSYNASMSPTPMQMRRSISEAAAVTQGSKSVAASGIFVERWLALFARALQLGKEIANQRSSSRYDTGGSEHFRDDSLRKMPRSLLTFGTDFFDDDEEAEDDSDESIIIGTDEVISAPPMCGLFLCLGMDDPNSHKADHGKSSMARSARKVQKLLGGQLKVVLDLKTRRVPPRVWARLVDNMRSRGIGVDGLGSFDMDELRSISSFCCTPVSKVIFLHSAGDLQRACHAQEIKRGDTVFFNAGSLIWKKPTLCEATGFGCCAVPTSALSNIDMTVASSPSDSAPGAWNNSGVVLGGYIFQPYAYPREKLELLTGVVQETMATLEDYQKHLNLNIGLYVQEFSVGDSALDALSRLVNHYPSIYNLGLAWGGINGATVKGVHGDGFWNQRYIGRDWDLKAEPTDHMKLLAPEDHHLFQKAIHTSDWGQALTVNQIAIDPDGERGLHVPLCESPGCH